MGETCSTPVTPPGGRRCLLYGLVAVVAMPFGFLFASRDIAVLQSKSMVAKGQKIDERYADVRKKLPLRPMVIGYANDYDLPNNRHRSDLQAVRFCQAQYALAPHILQREPSLAPLVLVDLRDRALLAVLADQFQLEVTFESQGTYVARRRDGAKE